MCIFKPSANVKDEILKFLELAHVCRRVGLCYQRHDKPKPCLSKLVGRDSSLTGWTSRTLRYDSEMHGLLDPPLWEVCVGELIRLHSLRAMLILGH